MNDITILNNLNMSNIDTINNLTTPTKNKLISIASIAIKKNIGNKELSRNILNNIYLTDIYLNKIKRKDLSSNIKRNLREIKNVEDGKQCKDVLINHINFEKKLGAGSFGEVSLGNLKSQINTKFAIKMSTITRRFAPTFEVHINRLISELVLNNITQNLPITIESFNCDSCKFENAPKTKKCIFYINEIANGDLESWFKTNPEKHELESALFQIMAGIHAYQYYYNVVNNDIKAPNILFYNVNPGGYWKYTIYGRDFYVPNYGKLFIVNDFGVAQIFSPKYNYKSSKEQPLGDRLFMINNHNFEILNSKSVERADLIRWANGQENYIKKNYLLKNKIYNFPTLNASQKRIIGYDSNQVDFYNSNLVPPLEVLSDTQDVINMFIGGKARLQQSVMGLHIQYNLNTDFVKTLNSYRILRDGIYSSVYSTLVCHLNILPTDLYKFLAGYFILHYFTNVVNYTIVQNSDNIINHIKTS